MNQLKKYFCLYIKKIHFNKLLCKNYIKKYTEKYFILIQNKLKCIIEDLDFQSFVSLNG